MEAMGQDDEDELSALQSEQDMPIEELLKMYGYNNSQQQESKEETKEEEQGHTMYIKYTDKQKYSIHICNCSVPCCDVSYYTLD